MSMNQSHQTRLLLCLLGGILLLGTGVCGCKKDGDNDRKRGRKRDINALRGMPYAGGTEGSQDEPSGVVFRDEVVSCPGYNLYTIQKLCRTDLIDEDGNLVNTWSLAPGERWVHSELLPNGDLLVVGADEYDWPEKSAVPRVADESRFILRFNWMGELLWKRMLLSHHDIEMTPAGNLLMLGLKRVRDPQINPDVDVCDVLITMLNGDGKVLESRSVLDAVHRNAEMFPLDPVQPDTLGGPEWVDLFHANSIQWIRCDKMVGKHPLYGPGNILVCFRHQNRVAVFNWAKGELVWAWGRDQLDGPHDAQILDNGHLLVFDNGLGRGYSRVIEVDPITEKIVWQYKDNPPSRFFTPSKGSAQRLPNGNTLIAESDKAHAFEVTPEGEPAWDFVCPHEFDPENLDVWVLSSSQDGHRSEVAKNDNRIHRATIVRMKRFSREFVDGIIRKHGKPDLGRLNEKNPDPATTQPAGEMRLDDDT